MRMTTFLHRTAVTAFVLAVAIGAASLTGCSTVATMSQHHSLEVKSSMTKSVFIDPVSPSNKTLFLQVRNTSGKSNLDVQNVIASDLRGHGWTLTTDPKKAKVLLQVNIRQAGKAKKNAIESAMQSGYGGGIFGSGATGAGIAAVSGAGVRGVGAAALAGGAADYVGGLLVKDVMYTLIADVQVSRRADPGQSYTVTHTTSEGSNDIQGQVQGLISMAQGKKSSVQTDQTVNTYTEKSDFKREQTRVLATAEKVNLKWPEASGPLSNKLASAIGGML